MPPQTVRLKDSDPFSRVNDPSMLYLWGPSASVTQHQHLRLWLLSALRGWGCARLCLGLPWGPQGASRSPAVTGGRGSETTSIIPAVRQKGRENPAGPTPGWGSRWITPGVSVATPRADTRDVVGIALWNQERLWGSLRLERTPEGRQVQPWNPPWSATWAWLWTLPGVGTHRSPSAGIFPGIQPEPPLADAGFQLRLNSWPG